MQLSKERVLPIIKAALKEDIGKEDITTSCIIGKLTSIDATVITREECAVCGLLIAEWIINTIDYSVRFKPMCKEGDVVGAGGELAIIEGHAHSILRAERTMINFVSFLSGISTKTKKFVDAVSPYGVKIMDTRKTYPLLRYLEKYAVSVGGGVNHRMGLYDQVLIKDNHIKAHAEEVAAAKKSRGKKLSGDYRHEADIGSIVKKARKYAPKGARIEIEVDTLEEFGDALLSGPDIVMLDNMRIADVRACVELRRRSQHKPLIEVSGGITLDNVKDYAQCGVDMISIGSLTGSVNMIDMSLEMV